MARMQQDSPGRAWASPGSVAEPAAPARDAATGRAQAAVPGRAPAPPPVPHVALRPMTVADVLDGGFSVIKARPRRILTLTAAFVVPVQILAAWLQRDVAGGLGLTEVFGDDPTVLREASGSSTGGGELLGLIALLLVPSLALVCLAAAIGHLVSGWSVGHDASGRELVRLVASRWWPLLATFVVVHAAEVAGVFSCYIGSFAVMALFVVVAPIVGVENPTVGETLGRSVRLVRGRFWPVLGTAVLMGVVSSLLGNTLSALPQGVAALIGFDAAWPLVALGGILGQLVTAPFVAAATTLLYFDLRVRTEGLDIEFGARRAINRAG